MTRYNTLLLDQQAWDLVIDSAGDIAMAEPPYALAQDAATAVRTFQNELWYDPDDGIPYFDEILGQLPPLSLFKGLIEQAVLSVPGVEEARCVVSAFSGPTRTISGQIQFIDEDGVANNVSF